MNPDSNDIETIINNQRAIMVALVNLIAAWRWVAGEQGVVFNDQQIGTVAASMDHLQGRLRLMQQREEERIKEGR